MNEAEENLRLKEILKSKNLTHCKCGREIDRGDCSWNIGSTEAGTEYAVLNIICEKCCENLFYETTWYPGIDTFEEFLNELKDCTNES